MWSRLDLMDYIEDYVYLAHKDKAGTKKESLYEHSERAFEVLELIDSRKNIFSILSTIFSKIEVVNNNKNYGNLSDNTKQIIYDMFANAIYLHDAGKINPAFQASRIMNNEMDCSKVPNLTSMDTSHPFLSSAIFIDIFLKRVEKLTNNAERFFAQYMMFAFAQIIANHHGSLTNVEIFKVEKSTNGDVVRKGYENCIIGHLNDYSYDFFYKESIKVPSKVRIDNMFEVLKNIEYDKLSIYIVLKLLESLLITCDFASTYSFYNKMDVARIDLGIIENPSSVYDKYKQSKIYKGIQEYNRDNSYFDNAPINALRSQMFNKAEETLLNNLDKHIFNLSMPTGAGKSNTAINLSLNLIEKDHKDKIFYIFPFNTLVDQTAGIFKKLFGGTLEYEVINSIYPALERVNNKGYVDYGRTLIDRQMMNHPVILTSHVRLFDMLFGVDRVGCMPLFQLINSVIVLDEIQSYRNSIWREIIEFLYKYSEVLNIKLIIMSATLPNLQKLIGFNRENFVELIDDSRYFFEHRLFKGRTKNDYSMYGKRSTFEEIQTQILKAVEKRNETQGHSKVLVEFIKKPTAKLFYSLFKTSFEKKGYIVLELTGDDNSYERKRVLKLIETCNDRDIILVATQIIEAGVDIDMDIGFKDTAVFDGDEQFLGRINRNCLKEDCTAYFFSYDDEKQVYDRSDLRLGKNLNHPKYQEYMDNMEFEKFYTEVLDRVQVRNNELNKQGYDSFYADVLYLRYNDIYERMRLIKTDTFQIFIPYTIEMEQYDSKGNITGTTPVNGREVWTEYTQILEDPYYDRRRVRLMKLNEKLDLFTFQLYGDGIFGMDSVQGIYYIENGSQFIKDNKFNLEAFKSQYKIANY